MNQLTIQGTQPSQPEEPNEQPVTPPQQVEESKPTNPNLSFAGGTAKWVGGLK